jgi:hypothetical protein
MAKMVHEGLFVGNSADTYGFQGSILHCAKLPWYVEAQERTGSLQVCPNVIREYYNVMSLNLIDANDRKFFSDEVINAGLNFITERFADGDPVLVHCNMGVSRSPSIAFLWMFEHGFLDDDFRYAMPEFKKLYPAYQPGNGVWQYLKSRCTPTASSPQQS